MQASVPVAAADVENALAGLQRGTLLGNLKWADTGRITANLGSNP
jgi:hypothetical protein